MAEGMRVMRSRDVLLCDGGLHQNLTLRLLMTLVKAGTAENSTVERLLHIAVSETADNVQRAAVASPASLLFRNPRQVPRTVQLLSESYNPHV